MNHEAIRDYVHAKCLTALKDPSQIVFLGIAGSHAYGTSTAESDVDITGAFIPPIDYLLGNSVMDQVQHKNDAAGIDSTIYSLRKLMHLLKDCNPNIIEVLFLPQSCLLQESEVYSALREHAHLFATKKARYTFAGYAVSQMKRIRSHRAWLLNPPSAPPTRGEFGLPDNLSVSMTAMGAFNALVAERLAEVAVLHPLREAMLEHKEIMPSWASVANSAVEFTSLASLTNLDHDIVDVIIREKRYQAAKAHWESYQNWKINRNPKRAALEAKFGYDCKHASHLMRLIYEGEELLTTGKLSLPPPWAEVTLAIKQGAWTYDMIESEIDQIDRKFDLWYQLSPLPKAPDIKAIDNLLIDFTLEKLYSTGELGACSTSEIWARRVK